VPGVVSRISSEHAIYPTEKRKIVQSRSSLATLFLSVALLAACGGGGAGGDPNNGGGSGANTNAGGGTGDTQSQNARFFAYALNHTSGNVSAYTLNPETGALSEIAGSPFPTGGEPMNFTVASSGKFAIVASAQADTIWVYAINPSSGALTQVPGSPFGGADPFGLNWIAVTPSGEFIYEGKSLSGIWAYAVNGSTGELSEIPGSPFNAGTSPGRMTIHPSGKFAYLPSSTADVPLVGLAGYRIDPGTGVLSPVPGGPFEDSGSVVIEPAGRFAYAHDTSGRISAFSIDGATGSLSRIPGSPFALSLPGSGFALGFGFDLHPDRLGQFLYLTGQRSRTYGTDQFGAYAIDANTGALSPVAGSPFTAGSNPSTVTADASGKFAYVTNAFSDTLSAYSVSPGTGTLTQIAGSPFRSLSIPFSCDGPGGCALPDHMAIDPSGKFAYVTNVLAKKISAYGIDPGTGALTEVAGSPFSTGDFPERLVIVRAPG
jgi:6-phosphogluconolactonase (cycloisomerase 2 family)